MRGGVVWHLVAQFINPSPTKKKEQVSTHDQAWVQMLNPLILTGLTKFSQKNLKTLSEALETLIFEFLIENCVETVKKVFFWQN